MKSAITNPSHGVTADCSGLAEKKKQTNNEFPLPAPHTTEPKRIVNSQNYKHVNSSAMRCA